MWQKGKGELTVNQIIIDAINSRCLLVFTYEGYPRVVEPYAYGLSQESKEMLRCFQTGGGSDSEPVVGWRLIDLDRAQFVSATNQHFSGTRPQYVKGDKDISNVFCEQEPKPVSSNSA